MASTRRHARKRKPKYTGSYPSEAARRRAGREMKDNPPSVLSKTRRKHGKRRAEKQRVAILLDKARRSGARKRPSRSQSGRRS